MVEQPHKWKGNRREIGEDFFETPSSAILPILKYIPSNVILWEPTNGKNAISKHFPNHNIIKTDKFPKTEDTIEFDFLTDIPDFEFDFLIFNPPFSLKTEFLQKAISYGKPFIFLCPITILETKKRSKMFFDNQLSIINLSSRTNFISGKNEKGNLKKVWFHSLWVLNDKKGKIYYEEIL